MKQTTFIFTLRFTTPDEPANQAAALHQLREQLTEVAGVLSVDQAGNRHLPRLQVQVEFEDSKSAEKIHLRLANRIEQTEHVMLAGVSTTLTDIY
jgi:hypothetical protein